MATEILEERIAFEAKRVAAAFGVEEWERYSQDEQTRKTRFFFHSINQQPCVIWGFNYYRGMEEGEGEIEYMDFSIAEGEQVLSLALLQVVGSPSWHWTPRRTPRPFEHLMTRGLFRLGFTDAAVLAQLPPLSAHEKLELRLSLPREFWPQSWLEEGENMPTVDN